MTLQIKIMPIKCQNCGIIIKIEKDDTEKSYGEDNYVIDLDAYLCTICQEKYYLGGTIYGISEETASFVHSYFEKEIKCNIKGEEFEPDKFLEKCLKLEKRKNK